MVLIKMCCVHKDTSLYAALLTVCIIIIKLLDVFSCLNKRLIINNYVVYIYIKYKNKIK